MKTKEATKIKMHMSRRRYERVQLGKRDTLCCDEGVLWVTRAGDRRDYILYPGDELQFTQSGRLLVEAMRDADFHVLN
jgi:hypothetical protein